MDPKEILNIHQFTILVILVTIGDAILVLPTLIATHTHQDAWIAMILGLCLGLINILLLLKIAYIYPKLNYVQAQLKILGKWIGSLFVLFFIFYLFLSITSHIRELGDFITTEILLNTPIELVHVLFILAIIYVVRSGLAVLARASEILYPVIFLFLLTLFMLVLPNIHFEWLKPMMANGFKPIMQGSLIATAFPFMELIAFLMIIPNVKETTKVKKGFLLGALIGGAILIGVVFLSIVVLSEEVTIRNIYPTFTLAKTINIDGIIHRIEGLIAIIWTLTIFLKIAFYTYALHIGLRSWLNLKDYKPFTIPIGFILYATVMLVSPNLTYFLNMISDHWPFYDVTIAVVIPLVLALVYIVRKKWFKTSLDEFK